MGRWDILSLLLYDPSQPNSLPQEADLYGLHQQSPMPSGFCLGSASGLPCQKIKEKESEVRVFISLTPSLQGLLKLPMSSDQKITSFFTATYSTTFLPFPIDWVLLISLYPCSFGCRDGESSKSGFWLYSAPIFVISLFVNNSFSNYPNLRVPYDFLLGS